MKQRGGQRVTTAAPDAPHRAGSTGDDDDRRPSDTAVNEGFRVLSMMVAGCLVYGFLGWLADRWLGTVWLLPAGILTGLGLAVYMVAKRYGASGTTPPWSGRDRSR